MIDPIPLGTVKRQFFAVHGKEVLAEELAQGRKQAAKPPDDGIVAAYGVFVLHHVERVENDGAGKDGNDQKGKQGIDEVKGHGGVTRL